MNGVVERGLPNYFAQGARFAVSRERLMQHPRAYYVRLLDEISHHTDPWQGYYYEYLWFQMTAAAEGQSER